MFKTAIEGYQLMIFVVLHLTILACDDTCPVPISFVRAFLPHPVLRLALTFVKTLPIEILTVQLIGQMMLIGDAFIVLLLVLKIFGCFLRRFVLMFGSLIVSIYAMDKLDLIWMIYIDLIIRITLSFSVSSCLPLIKIFFFDSVSLGNIKFPSWMNVSQQLDMLRQKNFEKMTAKDASFE